MKNYLLLMAICIASFLGCLDLTIVNTALPTIQHVMNVNIDSLQWIITGLLATLSGTMVLAGRLADIFGHRRLLIIGLLIFGFASLLAGAASTIDILIIARILQGFGIAILYTAPPAFINHAFEKEKVAKAMGCYFSASSLGLASGPLLGGLIVGSLGWPWIFYLNIPFVLISLFIVMVYSPKNEIKKTEKLDIKGAAFLVTSLIVMLLATNYIGSSGFFGVALLVIAVFGLFLFIRHEKNCPEPMLDLNLFRYPTFVLGGIANIALACFYANAFFLMPLYLSIVKHFDAMHIGLILLPATLTLAIISPWVNKLVERFSIWKVLAAGFFCFTMSAFLQQNFSQATSVISIMLTYSLIGIGWALILSPSFTSALTTIPKQQSGVAMGALGTMHNAGGSIGLAIGVILFGKSTAGLSAQQFIENQNAPFVFIGAISILLLIAILVYERSILKTSVVKA